MNIYNGNDLDNNIQNKKFYNLLKVYIEAYRDERYPDRNKNLIGEYIKYIWKKYGSFDNWFKRIYDELTKWKKGQSCNLEDYMIALLKDPNSFFQADKPPPP